MLLDLKDSLFCFLLVSVSQPIFTFEWIDLEGGYTGQLTWAWLPQEFQNSPTWFDEALSSDL